MTVRNDSGSARSTIAIVGFSVRAAAQCSRRQGFDVVAVDFCSDRDLLSECTEHFHLDDPNWPNALNSKYPAVPILLAGGMEHRTRWVDQCSTQGNRLVTSPLQLTQLRSLDNWASWAAKCKIGWPITLADHFAVESHFGKGNGDTFEWLKKPIESTGGIGISKLDRATQLRDLNWSEPSKFYLQQSLPGRSIGVAFLSSEFGSSPIGATAAWNVSDLRHQSSESNFKYHGSAGPIALTDEQVSRLQCFASQVASDTGIMGLWQADFIDHAGELSLLEINPRWSASMDLLDVGLGLELVTLHTACINQHIGKQPFKQLSIVVKEQMAKPASMMLGKLIVYANQHFIVSTNQSNQWWADRWHGDVELLRESLSNRCLLADIPCAGTAIGKGEPILTFMTAGESEESMLHALQSAQIRWEASMMHELL